MPSKALPVKIILYGEGHIEGTGAWCYAQAIKEMGHEVLLFRDDYKLEQYANSFFWKIIRRLNGRQVLKQHRNAHNKALLDTAAHHNPDIIIILKGLHIGKEDIKKLKRYSPFVVNINHDDFFSLNKNNRSKVQFNAIPVYDYIFTTRQVNVPEVKKYNNRVELFMFSYYPLIHQQFRLSKAASEKYACDVLFIGTYEKHRAALLEKLMTNFNVALAIYGKGWDKLNAVSVLKKYVKSTQGLWMQEMSKAIQAAKITLGFLRKENRDEYTQRSFEIPVSGGVLLAERSNFHQKLFEEGKEAIFFNPADDTELRNKIIWLLENDAEREKIREAGHKKISEGKFTYNDRINQLVERYHEYKR